MAVKLLSNISHNGLIYQTGLVVAGLEQEVEASLIKRGLAEVTEEAVHHTVGADSNPEGVTTVSPPAGAANAPKAPAATPAVANPATAAVKTAATQAAQTGTPATGGVVTAKAPTQSEVDKTLSEV